MKNKIIILAMCAGLLAGATAQAQEVKIVPDSQKVVFSDNITPNTLGVCFVVKKGESIDDNSQVYALKNAKSNGDGKIEISFVMPEMKNETLSDGEYEIYIKEAGKAVKKAEFIYASLTTRIGIITAVKALPQDATKVQALKAILENADNLIALKTMGCETDYYNEKTAANMCEAISDFSNITEDILSKEYNTASVKDDFESAGKDKVDELLTVIDPEFEGVTYNSIADDSLTEWISSYFVKNTYSDKKYEEANILYKFNNVVSDKIDDLFEQYDETTDITKDARYIAYNKLSSKSKVNVSIAEALSKTPAKSMDSLLDVVAKAVNSVSKENAGGGGGGGVGGGFGGGSSTSDKQPIVSGIPTGTTGSTTSGTSGGSQGGTSGTSSFKDLGKAEWSRKAVEALAKTGIISGDGNGNFRPNDYVSREEFIKMIVVAANKYNANATCDFKDVSKDAWYYSYIASAKQLGLTSGISKDEFGIGKALTRQDMAVLALKAKGSVAKVREDVTFEDSNEIAAYAKDAVSKLYMSGAVSGTGNNKFTPLGQATRAESAQIIYNLFMN